MGLVFAETEKPLLFVGICFLYSTFYFCFFFHAFLSCSLVLIVVSLLCALIHNFGVLFCRSSWFGESIELQIAG